MRKLSNRVDLALRLTVSWGGNNENSHGTYRIGGRAFCQRVMAAAVGLRLVSYRPGNRLLFAKREGLIEAHLSVNSSAAVTGLNIRADPQRRW